MQVRSWSAAPIGPSVTDAGVGFSVYAPDAAGLKLLLFDGAEDDEPATVIRHEHGRDRTGPWWHTFVSGVGTGQHYAYREVPATSGTVGDPAGHQPVLLDPYARGVAVPSGYRREAGAGMAGLIGRSLKSVVVDTAAYDWEGDRPLGRPLRESVIYEPTCAA